uniref:Uncharacterized protein n=1 Tax=Magnetococcus massalia (strain MO-1) TaxID=451514 RepID=A0A1S7LL36_MAGMO|nr:protein of unknown function [Candidatus Magnetococcus massalia]
MGVTFAPISRQNPAIPRDQTLRSHETKSSIPQKGLDPLDGFRQNGALSHGGAAQADLHLYRPLETDCSNRVYRPLLGQCQCGRADHCV